MKPVELVENAILNSSKEGDIILDIFGGSGTTLIAAEKNNRKCRMMELDCHYIDVIIYRYIDWASKNNRNADVYLLKDNGDKIAWADLVKERKGNNG